MRKALCLAALMVAGGCTHPANTDPPAPVGLAERFELIAFYDEFSSEERPLYRWGDAPIEIVVDDRYMRDIYKLAEELSALTSRTIRIANRNTTPNFVVAIRPRQELLRLGEKNPRLGDFFASVQFSCAGQFYPESEGSDVLGFAIIFIDTDGGEDLVQQCIAQEITQALGLPNDIDDPDGTVFSSGSTRKTLSESDRNIVRILYDPRLQPGMTRAEAMPIVRQIAAELEAQQAEAK